MIIRATFNDNDFVSVLEKFFEQPLFLGVKYCVNKYRNKTDNESIKKYVDLTTEIDEYLKMIQDEDNFTKEQQDGFLNILKESLLDFIKECSEEDDYDYLSEELSLTIRKSVADKWENGEVVYYFPMHDTYITM